MPSSTTRGGAPSYPEQRSVTSCPPCAMRPKISCRWSSAPPACGFSRSCQLTSSSRTNARSALRSLEPPHAPRERVDDAVHEACALHRPIALGEPDRFLDHDLRRGLADGELGGGEA